MGYAEQLKSLDVLKQDSRLLKSPDSKEFIANLLHEYWPYSTFIRRNMERFLGRFEGKLRVKSANKHLEVAWGILSQSLGLEKIYAELEWAGREYWARPEFGFELSPSQPRVIVEGEERSFDDLIRFNLANFLEQNALNPQELVVETEDGIQPFELKNVGSAADLLGLRRRNNQRIAVEVLKHHKDVKSRPLHVGRAFLMANHAPRSDQKTAVTVSGKSYSDSAMPSWFGVIHTGCDGKLVANREKLRKPAGRKRNAPSRR